MSALHRQLHQAFLRRMNGPYLRTVCYAVIGVFLVVQTISFATSRRGPTAFGPYLGADFAVFYVAGTIYNTYAPERIYDADLHTRLYHGLFPTPPTGELPYTNAPFFALPFAVLAQLPYPWAYLLWMTIACALYLGGLHLLRKNFGILALGDWGTALLLALSFAPFLFEGLAGGQVSAFGFFWLALAMALERRGHRVAGGAALAVLAYKPTLLVLILPMLVVTRRARVLCGFAAGTALLTAVSLLAVGWQGCLDYLQMLLRFLHVTSERVSPLRTWKYVDINSFARLLAGGQPWLRYAIVAVTAAGVLPLLVRMWAKADRARDEDGALVWAATIVWTLVLNIYVGIYDTILVVPAVAVATDLVNGRGQHGLTGGYRYLLAALYLTPWVTQPLARLTGIQPYTLVLALFGCYLLALSQEMHRYAADGNHPA